MVIVRMGGGGGVVMGQDRMVIGRDWMVASCLHTASFVKISFCCFTILSDTFTIPPAHPHHHMMCLI